MSADGRLIIREEEDDDTAKAEEEEGAKGGSARAEYAAASGLGQGCTHLFIHSFIHLLIGLFRYSVTVLGGRHRLKTEGASI